MHDLAYGQESISFVCTARETEGNWSYPCCYWRIQRALKFVLCMRKRAMQNILKNNSFSSKKCISFLSERSGSDTQNRN